MGRSKGNHHPSGLALGRRRLQDSGPDSIGYAVSARRPHRCCDGKQLDPTRFEECGRCCSSGAADQGSAKEFCSLRFVYYWCWRFLVAKKGTPKVGQRVAVAYSHRHRRNDERLSGRQLQCDDIRPTIVSFAAIAAVQQSGLERLLSARIYRLGLAVHSAPTARCHARAPGIRDG